MTDSTNEQQNSRPRILLVNRCFVLDETKSKFLLIKRSAQDSNNPGLWEVPGGKLDEGQDLSHALEREVLEETGLLVEPSQRLMYADSQMATIKKYEGMLYLVLFGIGQIVGGKLQLSEEHEDSAWVTYDEALDYNLSPEVRKALIILQQHLIPQNI